MFWVIVWALIRPTLCVKLGTLRSLHSILTDWPLRDLSGGEGYDPDQRLAGLPVFNWSTPTGREGASATLNAELPFVLTGVPDFDRLAALSQQDTFLARLLGNRPRRADVSVRGPLLSYYRPEVARLRPGYLPPVQHLSLTLHEWVLLSREPRNDSTFYYYLLGEEDYEALAAQAPSLRNMPEAWLRFNQTPPGGPFVPEPAPEDLAELINVRSAPSIGEPGPDGKLQYHTKRWIDGRLGQAGIIVGAHFDVPRNLLVLLKGRKRYLLFPPSECPRLHIILDPTHPEDRHSTIDWADPAVIDRHPEAAQALALDVTLQPGEALFVPSFWSHLIVSLTETFQLNAMTTAALKGSDTLEKCKEGNPSWTGDTANRGAAGDAQDIILTVDQQRAEEEAVEGRREGGDLDQEEDASEGRRAAEAVDEDNEEERRRELGLLGTDSDLEEDPGKDKARGKGLSAHPETDMGALVLAFGFLALAIVLLTALFTAVHTGLIEFNHGAAGSGYSVTLRSRRKKPERLMI